MKQILFVLLTLLFISGCSEVLTTEEIVQDSSPSESKNEERMEQDGEQVDDRFIPATIVRVVDGDTMVVKLENGTEEKIRLLLVDTPETVHPSKPVEPFGPEASSLAKELMPEGKQVKIELDIGERDNYGRLLAYLWVDDKMFNELLLEKGLARVAYVFAPNTKHVDRFYEIQKQAQQAELGIWSIENYATDKGYNTEVFETVNDDNNETEVANCSNPTIKGNHSSKGEMIYHVLGGQYYEKTNAEEMFCTEEEAVAAGYRKSLR